MILPIISYGNKILTSKTKIIDKNYNNLEVTINNMFDTMYNAKGIGLAAPQINLPIKLFIIDINNLDNNNDKIFINPIIKSKFGYKYKLPESCLSIPNISIDIIRYYHILIQFYDKNFILKEKYYNGFISRVIQHEYDHLQGKTIVDRCKDELQINSIKNELNNIIKGNSKTNYKMNFPKL